MKQIWNWFNGKKRTIALIYWAVVVPGMMVIWPNGFPEGFPLVLYKVVTIVGFLLSALGLGHAAVKARAASKENSNSEDEEIPVQPEQIVEQPSNQVEQPNEADSKKDSGSNS